MSFKRVACAALVLLAAVSCGSSSPSAGAGGAGSGGALGSAGQAALGGGSGVPNSAGAAGSSGAVASGGTGGAQSGAGGAAGTGGSASAGAGTGGAAGAGGSAGSSGGASPAVPSAGCGKGGRPAGGEVTVAGDHVYDFPASYDGHSPMPMLVGFHANNNPVTQIRDLTNSSKLATNFVRVFPKSAGTGWVIGTDAAHVTTVFNDVLANYCVDTSRVFATGHSSGAQMVVQMLCAQGGEKRFKAVAPVAASKDCSTVAPIPIMYIQGMMDAMRGNSNGIDVVNVFTSSNGCTTATVPDTAVGTCNSSFDNMLVTPGCVTYQGCSKPTIWCSHNDNTYNSTDGHEHGWPCFASSAMADFFLGLP